MTIKREARGMQGTTRRTRGFVVAIPAMLGLVAVACDPPSGEDLESSADALQAAATSAVSAGSPGASSPSPVPVMSSDLHPDARGRTRVIVQLRPAAGASEGSPWVGGATDRLLGDLAPTQSRLQRRYQHLPFVALEVDGVGLQQLARHPGVAQVSPERQYEPSALKAQIGVASSVAVVKPAVAGNPDLWQLVIGAPKVRDAGFDGTGQAIAILDSGVDKTHPYLAGSVVMEACFAEGGNCPNGQDVQLGLGSAPPVKTGDGGVHGTHTAGIAVGRPLSLDGETRLQGVASGAQLVAIQVFHPTSDGCHSGEQVPCGRASTSDMIGGLDFVQFEGGAFHFAAVSMSIGGGQFQTQAACDDHDPALRAAIRDVRNNLGIPTIVSSGNDGFTDALESPACLDDAISVGNTDLLDTVNGTSDSASFLTLLAPGTDILSSIPGGGFARFTGTSMSAPQIAGAFALLKQAYPSATSDQIKGFLVSSGTAVTDGRNGLKKPRLDVFAAYKNLGAFLARWNLANVAVASTTFTVTP